MKMSGRSLKGDRFIIHPEIPFIAKFFVDVPDTKIWLTNPAPGWFSTLGRHNCATRGPNHSC
jgi:hypothetical protein